MNQSEIACEMLNEVLRRKMNSPAAYVLESSPYATENDRPIIEAFEALSATDRRHAEEAARRILLLEGVPQSGAYDPAIADSNYLSIRYSLGQLLLRLEANLALYERLREQSTVPEVRDFFSLVIEDDTAHRNKLRTLYEHVRLEPTSAPTHEPKSRSLL